jgi:hypothetical protein
LREAGARAALALLGIAPPRLHGGGGRGEAEIKAELPHLALLRSMTAFINALVTAPRSSGRGIVTPVAFRIASAVQISASDSFTLAPRRFLL